MDESTEPSERPRAVGAAVHTLVRNLRKRVITKRLQLNDMDRLNQWRQKMMWHHQTLTIKWHGPIRAVGSLADVGSLHV
jgi:hypothetical protein